MTNLKTNLLQVLTHKAARFCSRAVRMGFFDPARANAYDPRAGLSSMVLHRKFTEKSYTGTGSLRIRNTYGGSLLWH